MGQVRNMPRRGSRPIEEPETDPNAEAKAVALRYDMERDKAPKVVAKGKGYVAENIMAAAQKAAVPVYQNKTLVNMLILYSKSIAPRGESMSVRMIPSGQDSCMRMTLGLNL